jgi:ATP-dependent Clp protease ATP-binding subunit ClpX
MRPRNAYCSFCRKSYREVGPLVEGPDEVYICGECVELSQSVIVQEKRRRSAAGAPPTPTLEAVRTRLGPFVAGQEGAEALVQVALARFQSPGREHPSAVLLLGPTRSSKMFLARALAYALKVPFAAGDAQALRKSRPGAEEVEPFLYRLLLASDFEIEGAQRGIVYVDGVDQQGTQEALLRVWEGGTSAPTDSLRVDVARLLFVCGGEFAGLDAVVAGLGRHPEQPVSGDALLAYGAAPDLVQRLQLVLRVPPLDEETLARAVPWLAFDRMAAGNV